LSVLFILEKPFFIYHVHNGEVILESMVIIFTLEKTESGENSFVCLVHTGEIILESHL